MVFPNSTETWPKIAKALGLNEDARVRRVIIDVRWDAPAVVYVELFACEEVFEDATLEALLSGAEIVTNEQPTIEEATESQTAESQDCRYCGKRIGTAEHCYVAPYDPDGEPLPGSSVAHALCHAAYEKQRGGGESR
jgi:hypothetical protein